MTEFWEEAFNGKQEMWGMHPAKSAEIAAEQFAQKGFKKILIPGIGYGRNAEPFLKKGIQVTGIEISAKAIALAEKHFGNTLEIQKGSVTEMPFDSVYYDGIFCHALIHLLDENERHQFISDCYNQLTEGGCMVFTTITKDASTYGQGKLISKDRFEQFGGIKMFFYDEQSIKKEFESHGLVRIETVIENYPFYLIAIDKSIKTQNHLG